MTATLATAPAAELDTPGWRDRLQPLVDGSGGWPLTLAVTVLAGLLRFLRLDQPATNLSNGKVVAGDIFDELYYACDSHSLMKYGVEHASTSNDARFCTLNDTAPAFVVHPPVGKWLIGFGEQLMGFNTWGWRLAAAVFGTLTILLVIRIGRRLTGSTLLGGLAGLFLALDGLHFVQSRIATLDVFLCFFVLAAFGAFVVDRDKIRQRLAEMTDEGLARGGSLGRRPWRLVAGVMLGLALGTKWSAVYPMAVMLVLTLFWEAGARRAAGIRAPWRTTLRKTTAPFVGATLVLPVAVYVGSWTGWFVTSTGYDRNWAKENHASWPLVPDAFRSLLHYHWEMWHFHQTLVKSHPYQSHPLSWPFLQRPVSYYYPSPIKEGVYGCQTSGGCSREVLAIGTPVLWWAMVPLTLALVYRWLSKRDWASASVLLLMLVSILAWIPSDQKNRTMFLFYALPSVPFLCLGLAIVAGWMIGKPGTNRRLWGSGTVGVYTSLVVLNFWWLYPVLAAVTIPYTSWHHRMWFSSWI
ncbi:MAG: phospholipid carrier-dependent glycosyltransferase [Frankiales bacterium]|nr:phospholipid carrier-dependent glycosyltransferase [Frankiales bacterium]